MSYNITTWMTRKLDNLVVPLVALTLVSADLVSRGFRPDNPEIAFDDKGNLNVHCHLCEAGDIFGKLLVNQQVLINQIHLCGEASGTVYNEILKPALEKSRGTLQAILVWEGGDYIQRLTVQDGQVEEAAAEIS